MYTNGKPSEYTVQPRLAEKENMTVTHSGKKRMTETKKCVNKGKQVAGQSIIVTRKQVDCPVERKTAREQNKIECKKQGFRWTELRARENMWLLLKNSTQRT